MNFTISKNMNLTISKNMNFTISIKRAGLNIAVVICYSSQKNAKVNMLIIVQRVNFDISYIQGRAQDVFH